VHVESLLCGAEQGDACPDEFTMQVSAVGALASVMTLYKRGSSVLMLWPTPELLACSIRGASALLSTGWRRLLTAVSFCSTGKVMEQLGGKNAVILK
jgi:hypothetical protein